METGDILTLVIYLVFIFGIGTYFYFKQDSTEEYFLAKRSLPGFIVGLSLVSTIIGSATLIGHPGEVFRTNMWALSTLIMLIPVVFFVVEFIVPFYRRTVGMSVYGYLETRFGYPARAYAGLIFVFGRFVKLTTTYFFLSVAIATLTGWEIPYIILVVGIVTVVYTLLGGIEAVVWMDAFQALVILGGGFLILGIVLIRPEVPPAAMFEAAAEGGKFSFGSLKFSLVRENIWIYLIFSLFWAFQRYCTDQHIVQRYLVAKSKKHAIKATFTGAFGSVGLWLFFMIIGALIWSFYKVSPNVIPPEVVAQKSKILPFFIKTQIPTGFLGVFVAALFSAGMSNSDSDLNAASSVVIDDFYPKFRPKANDKEKLLAGRVTVAVLGGLSIVGALGWVGVESAISFMTELISIAVAGVVGLFLMGFLLKNATDKGALAGIIIAVIFTAWGTLTSVEIPALGRTILDLGKFNYPFNAKLIGVFANILLFIVGWGVSRLTGAAEVDYTHLSVWGMREK